MAFTAKINSITIGAGGDANNIIDVDVSGSIEFLSLETTIIGNLCVVVVSPVVAFLGSDIEITGSKTIVPVIPRVFSFTSPDIQAIVRINVSGSGSVLSFTSPAVDIKEYSGIINVSPPVIILSNPEIEIIGQETIIFAEPGEVNFLGYSVKVARGEITFKHGITLFPTLPTMSFFTSGIDLEFYERIVGVNSASILFSSVNIQAKSFHNIDIVPPLMNFSSSSTLLKVLDIEFLNTKTVYKFILTGDKDGFSNIGIPISSFQTRIYSDSSAYLNVVIPGVKYSDEIIKRSNGNLELYLCYVEINDQSEIIYSEKILETQFDNIIINEGPTNQSITLFGYESLTQRSARVSSSKSVTIGRNWINNISTSNGKTTMVLAKPHPTLKAGDTAYVDSNVFIVGMITWVKSATNQTIQITEAKE